MYDELSTNYFKNLPNDIAMTTKVWGPPAWFFLHSMAMAYPKTIDLNNSKHIKKKNAMFNFLSNLGDVLPCELCSNSYNSYIKTPDLSISKYLNTRADLVYYMYLIHNKVNDKLGVPQCDRPSFSAVIKNFDKFIARSQCVETTQNNRIQSLLGTCDGKNVKKYKSNVNVMENGETTNKSLYVIILLLIVIFVLSYLYIKK